MTKKSVFRGVVKAAPSKKRSRAWKHSAFYETYMQSEAWKELRAVMIDAVGGQCERCPTTWDTVTLEVHHLTYERLGNEDPEDLEVLCPPCHVLADAERAKETAENREFNRLDGWATKVYGDNWMEYPGASEAEEAFAEWLESRS